MQKKQKIVIYGGTFDPPHKGHFALIKAALKTLAPSVIYVVPGFRSPFKETPCAPFSDRAEMLRAGLKDAGLGRRTHVKIHPYEFKRGRLTYTWQTAEFFRKAHPGAELYLLMGSDCLETFHRWKNYRRILASVRLVVGARDGFALKNPRGLPYIKLKGRFPLIASAELKVRLFSGQVQPGLCESVSDYITRRGLYLTSLRRRAAKLMTAQRFVHTIAVTRLALALAVKYGADTKRIALAGLLHDIARDRTPQYLAAYAARTRLKAPALKETLSEAPILLHAYVGAEIAKKRFGVKDSEVLRAIRNHTLGSPSPGLIDKILYVADLAAADRSFPEAAMVRKQAFRELGAAYAAANYVKLVCAFRTGKWIHPESVKVWNKLSEKNN